MNYFRSQMRLEVHYNCYLVCLFSFSFFLFSGVGESTAVW